MNFSRKYNNFTIKTLLILTVFSVLSSSSTVCGITAGQCQSILYNYSVIEPSRKIPAGCQFSDLIHSNNVNYDASYTSFWNFWANNFDKISGALNPSYTGIQAILDTIMDTSYLPGIYGNDIVWIKDNVKAVMEQAAYYLQNKAPGVYKDAKYSKMKDIEIVQEYLDKLDRVYAIDFRGLFSDIKAVVTLKKNCFDTIEAIKNATAVTDIINSINTAKTIIANNPTSQAKKFFGATTIIGDKLKTTVSGIEARDTAIQKLRQCLVDSMNTFKAAEYPTMYNTLSTALKDLDTKIGKSGAISPLKAATSNKNLAEINSELIAAINTPVAAAFKTELNNSVLAALKVAVGLAQSNTDCSTIKGMLTAAKKNISSSNFTKISTEVDCVSKFYTNTTFDALNNTLKKAISLTPVTENFANHVHNALTKLITLIPSGVVKSPAVTRADLTANKNAATARAKALKAAKTTLDAARKAKFMRTFNAKINSLSLTLPKK